MATLFVQCPNCQHRLELDTGFAGGVCRCSHCGALMKVPQQPEQPADALTPATRPAAPGGRPESPLVAATAVTDGPADTTEPPATVDPADADLTDAAGAGAASNSADSPPGTPAVEKTPSVPVEPPRGEAKQRWRDPNEATSSPRDRVGRLQHYLRALVRHYGRRTPADLSSEHLPVHARYLEHRHHGIARRLGRLLDPGSERHQRGAALARQDSSWREAFNLGHDRCDALLREANECAQYWSRVVREGRLPSAFSFKLTSYSTRPIAHPWTTADASTLERLAQIDAELDAEDAHRQQVEAETGERDGSRGNHRRRKRSGGRVDLDDELGA